LKKISIVVPIYNTGEYLHKCIKSILAQSLNEFELILVNDGSTDNSGDICDEYAKSDSRVKVIHKKNEGVSIARNVGIEMATGEYIGFIDSDDWIEINMYSDMYNFANKYNVDIVMCDTVSKFDNAPDVPDTIVELNEDILLQKSDISPELLKVMAGSACRCIYKRDLIFNNNILFPINIPISEDRIFNIYAFGHSQKIYYTKKPYYNRYIRDGSAVHRHVSNIVDLINIVYDGYRNALELCWNDKNYVLAYQKLIVYMAFSSINNIFYKDSSFSIVEKYNEVEKLCNLKVVRDSILSTKSNDIRSRLIMKKHVFLLCLIAKILNLKYNR